MRQVLIFLLISIFFASCIAEFQKDLDKIGAPDWSPQVGIPFISGTFTMEDYVDATSDEISISQSSEGVVVIEYSGDQITSDYAEDLIEVPTQSFDKQVAFTNNEIINFPITGSLNITRSFDNEIVPEPGSTDVIDSVLLKAGTLFIDLETAIPADGQVELTINTLSKDGLPIVHSTGWTYNPLNPGAQTIRETIDLAGVFGDFTKGGSDTNNFNFDIEATLTFDGQPLSPTDNIKITIEVQDPKFRIVYGKFSERSFETELETVALGLFDSVDIEGFYLDQPKVEFSFKSSYGVPVEAGILTLEAVNSNGQVLPFSGTAISEPTEVSGVSLDQIGTVVETALVIDKTNSNITDVISFLPSELTYEFSGTVISPGPTTTQFVLDTSRVIGEYKVTLPLDGRVARFESNKSIEMDASGDLDFLGESVITLKSINGLPIKVGLEIQFIDEFDNEIFTLFKDQKVLEPGIIDQNGFVTSANENIIEQRLTGDEARSMLKASGAIIKTILNTGETGTENVKFRMTDEVKIALFLETSLKL